MITAGFIVIFGFLLLAVKLPIKTKLKLLGRPLTLDLTVSILAYTLHWGTFTGVMAAAVAGLLCSVMTSSCRWAFGYIEGGYYHRGKIWRYR